MKKIFLIFTCVCLVLCAFAGCTHTCTFKQEWSSDDTHHWHDCTGAYCTEKGSYNAHTLVDTVCSVCNKHVCDFKSEWTTDDENHWHDCKGANCTLKNSLGAHTFENGACTTCSIPDPSNTTAQLLTYQTACNNVANYMLNIDSPSPTGANGSGLSLTPLTASVEPPHMENSPVAPTMVKGVATYVKLLADMLVNPSFVLTDKAVIVNASFSSPDLTYSETFSAYLAYKFDEENNKIMMNWDVTSQMNSGTMNILMYLDIDYNFEQGEVVGFHIKSVQISADHPEYSTAFSVKCIDGVVTAFFAPGPSLETYAYYFENEQEQIDAKKPTAIDLNADFSTEYATAMLTMNPQWQTN